MNFPENPDEQLGCHEDGTRKAQTTSTIRGIAQDALADSAQSGE